MNAPLHAPLKPLSAVAETLGLAPDHLHPWGKNRAKIDLAAPPMLGEEDLADG